jgi:hypothetical protein
MLYPTLLQDVNLVYSLTICKEVARGVGGFKPPTPLATSLQAPSNYIGFIKLIIL